MIGFDFKDGQGRPSCRHTGFIIVVGSTLRHAMSDHAHDFLLAAKRRQRISIAKRFGVSRQVGFEVVVFLRAAICNSETSLDLVENEDTAIFLGTLADEFQEASLRVDRCAIALTRLGDDSRDLMTKGFHHAFEAFDIVERQGDNFFAHRLWEYPKMQEQELGCGDCRRLRLVRRLTKGCNRGCRDNSPQIS